MRKAHRKNRGTALLITSALNAGEWSTSHHTPAAFSLGKTPLPIE
jgi:hypothetical protein